MNKIVVSALLLLTCIIAGCKKDSAGNPVSSNTPIIGMNTPVVANTQNAFSLNLTAESYSSTATYTLSFSTDSLACSLTVTGQTTGNASLRITDSNNSVVYVDSLLNNQVTAFTQAGKGIPKSLQLIYSNYTGVLTFALAKNNTSK
jgi:hypothetical protein